MNFNREQNGGAIGFGGIRWKLAEKIRYCGIAFGTAVFICVSCIAKAQSDFPSKPVMIVIPFAAGGTVDSELLYYTSKLQANTKQPWVFDFRTGAGSTIGVSYVLKAKPDGYTILATTSSLTYVPNFYAELNHNVLTQLIPVIELSRRDSTLTISTAALPNVRSLADLITYGKTNPGKLNCATGGAGTGTHIACAALAHAIGVPIAAVHYKGGGPAMTDLAGGHVQMAIAPVLNVIGQVQTGKMRVIAVMGANRAKLMPDIPTTNELRYDVDYPSWAGIFAPPRTPQVIVTKINTEFFKAVKSPEAVTSLEKVGANAIGSSEADFRKKFFSELATVKKVVETNKITMEQ